MSDPLDLLRPPGVVPAAMPAAEPEALPGQLPQEQPEPAGDSGPGLLDVEFQKVFGAVQRALQMASYLPVEQSGITRVAVVSRQGQLIASAALDSPLKARFLLDQLHPLGFEERSSTDAIQELGCDLLVVHAANLEYGQVQGIVRGLDSQRWPPEG